MERQSLNTSETKLLLRCTKALPTPFANKTSPLMKKLALFVCLILFSQTLFGQSVQNMQTEPNEGKTKMKKAYEISNKLIRERLKNESDTNSTVLEEISKSDLVVIDGTYDHIHMVLDVLELPYQRITQSQVMAAKFEPHQTIFVNCASGFPKDAARKLSGFVAEGGQMITTDWALKHVLQVAFPGYVEYNNKPTRDEVVRIEIVNKEDPVIKGFLDEETDPVWWLEGSSYPIKILDTSKVEVLIKSKQLKASYGQEPVLIKFTYGKGIVYHMISHFYLQRTETKNAMQTAGASDYIKSKGGKKVVEELEKDEDAKDLNYGEVQSANTSAEFIMRAIIKQKKKVLQKQEK